MLEICLQVLRTTHLSNVGMGTVQRPHSNYLSRGPDVSSCRVPT